MEKSRLIIVITILAAGFTSCGKADVYLNVLRGNYAYGRGEFQEANVMYLQAAEEGLFSDILAYNLGNVYHALGESEAALEQWDAARLTGSRELLPEVLYNEGVLRYELGDYEESYRLFRQVLEMDSLRDDARINLEYALKKNSARNQAPRSLTSVPDETRESGDLERVLQYVKRKEQTLWGSGTAETEYQRDW